MTDILVGSYKGSIIYPFDSWSIAGIIMFYFLFYLFLKRVKVLLLVGIRLVMIGSGLLIWVCGIILDEELGTFF